jgi:hypothetical protein
MHADVGHEPVVLVDATKRQVFQRSVNGQHDARPAAASSDDDDEVLPLVVAPSSLKNPALTAHRFIFVFLSYLRSALVPILRPRTVVSVLNQLTWIIAIQALGSVYEFPGFFSVSLGLMSLLALHELPAFIFGRCWVLLAAADWFIIILSSILSVYRKCILVLSFTSVLCFTT